tara:strand:- start:116 stop:634 length:519 start_codon:yes stop_codon:yes gene_type:complete
MKKTIMVIALMISANVYAQKEYKIKLCKDAMTDKEYAFGSKYILCTSSDNKKGFSVSVSWNIVNGEVTYSGLIVKSIGIGTCNEKDKLIILFDDGTKYSSISWNDFNCDGNSYFDLQRADYETICHGSMSAIRFTNGRSFDDLTYTLTTDKDYFIQVKNALANKLFVNSSCN